MLLAISESLAVLGQVHIKSPGQDSLAISKMIAHIFPPIIFLLDKNLMFIPDIVCKQDSVESIHLQKWKLTRRTSNPGSMNKRKVPHEYPCYLPRLKKKKKRPAEKDQLCREEVNLEPKVRGKWGGLQYIYTSGTTSWQLTSERIIIASQRWEPRFSSTARLLSFLLHLRLLLLSECVWPVHGARGHIRRQLGGGSFHHWVWRVEWR